MSAKRYPIDLENIGEDVYLLMSKGHHDPHEFMKHVREAGYSWSLGMPVQAYCRTMPHPSREYLCRYVFADAAGPGTYPITYASEAYGDDVYEAKAASAGAA